MNDYLEFYDTKAKPELIHFAQNFKKTIVTLTEFLGLSSSDLLQETIASLLKYTIKHKVSKKFLNLNFSSIGIRH